MTETAMAMTVIQRLKSPEVEERFKDVLGERAPQFLASAISVVNGNAALKECDPISVQMAVWTAATLDLPVNSNLGFAYIIPYNQKYKDEAGNWATKKVAQFQMGYKGFIQLAQRSGQYKTISAVEVYEGQLVKEDPLLGNTFDWSKKKSDKIIGYVGYFALRNGFEKTMYMTEADMQKHAARYSKTYNKESGLWTTDKVSMAIKTVIKLLLSKFGPLTIEMQKAIQNDQAAVDESEEVEYPDRLEARVDPADPIFDDIESGLKAMEKVARKIVEQKIKLILDDRKCASIQELAMVDLTKIKSYINAK